MRHRLAPRAPSLLALCLLLAISGCPGTPPQQGCTAHTDCNDGDLCTDDSCDARTGLCTYANNTRACDDGDACTEDDVCVDGTCVGTVFDCDVDQPPVVALSPFGHAVPVEDQMTPGKTPTVVAEAGDVLVLGEVPGAVETPWAPGEIIVVEHKDETTTYELVLFAETMPDGSIGVISKEVGPLATFNETNVRFSQQVSLVDPSKPVNAKNTSLLDGVCSSELDLADFSGFEIYDQDGLRVETREGCIRFEPRVDVELKIKSLSATAMEDLGAIVFGLRDDLEQAVVHFTAEVGEPDAAIDTVGGLLELSHALDESAKIAARIAEFYDAVNNPSRIERALIAFDGELSGRFNVAVGVEREFVTEQVFKISPADFHVPLPLPIPITATGNVLLVLRPTITGSAELTAGVTFGANVSGWVLFENGILTQGGGVSPPAGAGDEYARAIEPTLDVGAKFTARASIQPKIGLSLLGLIEATVNPSVYAELFATADAELTPVANCFRLRWDLYAGLDAYLIGGVPVLGLRTERFPLVDPNSLRWPLLRNQPWESDGCYGSVCPDDSYCDDGLFCNGIERCILRSCGAGTDPCPDRQCNEDENRCEDCEDIECDDGDECTLDTCEDRDERVVCVSELVDCGDQLCDPADGSCVECLDSRDCGDGLFCNGAEACVGRMCTTGQTPCQVNERCDENDDVCEPAPQGPDLVVSTANPEWMGNYVLPPSTNLHVDYTVTNEGDMSTDTDTVVAVYLNIDATRLEPLGADTYDVDVDSCQELDVDETCSGRLYISYVTEDPFPADTYFVWVCADDYDAVVERDEQNNCQRMENATATVPESVPICGNGNCESGETCSGCPQDCHSCGDGCCTSGETCTTCPSDCGTCPGGETIVIQPEEGSSADARVSSEFPNNNYATRVLRVGVDEGKILRTFIKFDLGSIPSGATVEGATLTLHAGGVNGVDGWDSSTLRVHRVSSSWSEQTITWNNQASFEPAVLASESFPHPGWYDFDVKTTVQVWVEGGDANNGFVLKVAAEGPSVDAWCSFSYSGSSPPDERPKLTVTYVP